MKEAEKIEKELESEKKRLVEIEQNIEKLMDQLEKRPVHFSIRDMIVSFFGALIISLSFIHKGALITLSSKMGIYNIILIVLMTLAVLFLEIYFIGYHRVKNKAERPLGQFMAKRMVTFYLVGLMVPLILVFVFGIDKGLDGFSGLVKFVISVSMPSAVGAAVIDLLKKY